MTPWWGGPPSWKRMIFFPLPLPQLMQQQAALMASVAQGGYLNPMAAFAAAQMQQMAALNMNGLAAAPMTPTSGEWAGTNTRPGLAGKLLNPGWYLGLANFGYKRTILGLEHPVSRPSASIILEQFVSKMF